MIAFGRIRINSPDPSGTSISAKNPSTWNRYSYTGGDPVNRFDPRGLCFWDGDTGEYWDDTTAQELSYEGQILLSQLNHSDGSCTDQFAAENSALGAASGDGGISNQVGPDAGGNGHATRGDGSLWGVMGAAYTNALQELENPECAQTLGQGTLGNTVYSASQVLSLLVYSNVFGSITAAPLISPPGLVVSAQTSDVTVVKTPSFTYDTVSITLNTSTGYYVYGTVEQQTLMLLHELGHAMDYIFGPGTNQMDQTDMNNAALSGGNDGLIASHCFQ